jgi:hypothetical protein
VLLLLVAGLLEGAAAAPWTVAPGAAEATVTNAAGARLALVRGSDGVFLLDFTAPGRFTALSRASCPTFQIDRRTPLHHFATGGRCRIEGAHALLALGAPRARILTSTALYQLMNGDEVSFRYLTADEAYHETTFGLERSRAAVRQVLGRGVRVRPDPG